MMKIKKIMLVALVLLAILTMGAVSASEDVASDDDGLAVVDGDASVDAPAEEVETDDVLSYYYDDFDPYFEEDDVYLEYDGEVFSITPPVAGNLSVSVNDGVETSEHLYEITEEDVDYGDFGLTLSDLEIAQEGTYFISAKFISPSGDETTIFENAELNVCSEEEDDEYDVFLSGGSYSLSDNHYVIADITVPFYADGYVKVSVEGYDVHVIQLYELDNQEYPRIYSYYIHPNTLSSWVEPGTYQVQVSYYDESDEVRATDSDVFTFYNDGEDDEDDADDGVVIRVVEGDDYEFDLNDEEDLNAPFAFVSVQNDLSGRIVFIVWSIGEGAEQELFSIDLENITNTEEDPDNEGFTIYKLSLNDLGNYNDLINRATFKLAFIDDEDTQIDFRNYDIDYDDEEGIVTFSEPKDDADDGVVIRVVEGDEGEFDLNDQDDLNAPFAFVSVNNDLSGRIVIMVWAGDEGEEQQQFGIDLEDINNTEEDYDNEGFTIYKLSLNDLGNYDDFIECGSFKLAFIDDVEGEIDSRNYDIDYDDDEGIVTFWESDDDEDEEIHGEGDKIEAEFTDANILDNGAVVTISKDALPDDVDNEFTVFIPQEDDEPKEITLKLDEILEGDNYVIRVNDLELPEFREGYDILMILQFYVDDEEAYYAEWMDDEEPIYIYESPCIFDETSLFGEDDVITIQEIPEGVDEFTVIISKDGMDDIVKTFRFSELVEDEEDVWVSLKLADLGITEAGEYGITVKYSDDLTYSGNLNVTKNVDIRTHVFDDDGTLKTFESVDELVANLRISESVTGYVRLYVNGTQVGGNINFADLRLGDVPPEDGRQIILNDLKISESGMYKVKLEVYSDADELLGEKEFYIRVDVDESSVEINEDAYPYGTEANDEVIGYTIGAPLSDGQYFNIYFNGIKAGVITANGLEFNDEFTVPMFDVLLFKPGNYEVNVTFFDGETETDVTTGSFSVNELTLTSDKAVYIFEQDHIMISFNADSLDDEDIVKAYYVYDWGPVGRDDDMIFNPYGGKEMKEDGLYKDGVVSFDIAWTPDDRYRMDEGTTLIYVKYRHGDVEYGGFINVTVVEAPVPVDPELAIDPVGDVEEGTNVVITITALDNFTGSVKVLVGDVEVGVADVTAGSGTYGIAADKLVVGENTVFVVSEASENFTAGSANVTFTVTEKVVPPTPVPVDPGLAIAPVGDVEEGTNVVITISALDNFTGSVKVLVGGVEVGTTDVTAGSGTYGIAADKLVVGENTVFVVSEANENFTAGKANVTFTVTAKVVPPTPVDPGLAIAPVGDVEEGTNVVITISALANFTGGVKVLVGGVEVGTTDVTSGSGTYGIAADKLAVGENTVFVVSEANENFTAGEANVTFKVTAKGNGTDAGSNVTIPETVTQDGFDVVLPSDATGSILVSIDGKDPVSIPLVNGVAKVDLSNLTVGNHTISIKYEGDGKYSGFEKSASVQVTEKAPSPVPAKIVAKDLKAYYNNVKYSVTVYGTDGKVASGVDVVFKVNGVKVGTVKTDSKGVAVIKLKQLPKTYKITSEALGVSVTKKLTVKQVLTLKKVKVKKSAKKLVLKATLKEGKKALKGKKITFKFNGKKVKTVKTNKKGIAKVTIKKSKFKKLKVGKKVKYQAIYLKDKVTKSVKVKK